MKFFRLDLLTLLISLFILNSCKNQDTIGLGIATANQVNGNLIDTSTIVINTVPEDSVYTNALIATPLGYFKDPVLGTTESNLAIDLNLPNSTTYTLPTGTVTIDSAILAIRYAPGFYGDSIASRYKASVYQLNERLYTASRYVNTKRWKYNPTLLGSTSFFSKTNDSIKVVQAVSGGPDTLVKIPPQLRIPIDPSFVNNVLFNASATQLSSNLVFLNNVKGLYITLDKNQSGQGGTFMMALDSAVAIHVYYKSVAGTVTDTSSVDLPSTLHAAEIRHTYSTGLKTELSSTSASRKTVYYQGLGGLRTKISFPYLKNIIKTLGSDVLINRAELVVTVAPGTGIPFSPVRKLAMYRFDLANQRVLIQDNTSTDPRAFPITSGLYNTATQQYHFLVTAYIQDLIRGITLDRGTYISVVPNDGTANVAASAQVEARTIAVGSDSASPYRIKLNIVYTKISK